jgi:hypothetical protein
MAFKGLKAGPGQMQPTSRALRPGTSDDSKSGGSGKLSLGTIKGGPKLAKLPKGPTEIGKGVAMPKLPKLKGL